MPRPSRRRSRRSRREGQESPIAHRTRSRVQRQRRQEDAPINRSRPPRERNRAGEHHPAPPPAMDQRGEEQIICTICLSGYEDGEETTILHGAHEFHTSCIQQWLQESATCPLCRTPIPMLQQELELHFPDWFNNRFDALEDENGNVYYIDTVQQITYRLDFRLLDDGIVYLVEVPAV